MSQSNQLNYSFQANAGPSPWGYWSTSYINSYTDGLSAFDLELGSGSDSITVDSSATSNNSFYFYSGHNYAISFGVSDSSLITGSGDDTIDINSSALVNTNAYGYNFNQVKSFGLFDSYLSTGSGDDSININTTSLANSNNDWWGNNTNLESYGVLGSNISFINRKSSFSK